MNVNELVAELKVAKQFYYDGKPIMTDSDFDFLENKLREVEPNHDYFNQVGAPVRGEKVKHTIPMGSLNQVSDINEINKWIGDNTDVIYSYKLDGNSIALYYDEDGNFSRAVTRGDGIEGLDVTRHINRLIDRDYTIFRAVPKNIQPTGNPVVVRGEVIYAIGDFKNHVTGYKNPRNYVAGQLNRAVADDVFIEYVEIIAFDADYGQPMSKEQILETLQDDDFNVVPYDRIPQLRTFDYVEELAKAKAEFAFELDGLVLEFNNLDTRQSLGFDGLNPKYAVKFKINVDFIETTVIRVDWNPSKAGYMKPRVEFEPIDLGGVTINFATGHNAKFILDNKIGPGAVVRVTRSGEVIPYLDAVIKPTVADMPKLDESEYHWTPTGVDMVLNKLPDESLIKDIVDFFTSIDAPMLKIGNVTMLYEAGFTTIQKIVKATEDEMIVVLGENGVKAHLGLREKLQGIKEADLAGSLSFFGRGIGKRKISALVEMHGDILNLDVYKIMETPGFDSNSANKVLQGIPLYESFLRDLSDYITVIKFERIQGGLNGVAVCFTGVRDKGLENSITSKGGKILSSATKQMTHLVAKDPTGKSGKLDKARKDGVEILSLDEAKALWG